MMMRGLRALLLGAVGVGALAGAAMGADALTIPYEEPFAGLPAVSGVNGKWELSGGYVTPTGVVGGIAGSLSLPVGDRFGVQGDFGVDLKPGGLTYDLAGHAFTRDPSRYLVGVAAGVVVAPGASIAAIGAEGEVYLDRVSLEGWAGLAAVNYVDPATLDVTGFFGMGDIAYYATDDLRLAVGGRYILGDLSLRASTEYQVRELGAPLSFTADARVHASGDYSVRVGLKGYFGGDSDKSLIDRHRQDDPPNRGLDLASAGEVILNKTAGAPVDDPIDSDEECVAAHDIGWYWDDISEECTVG